MRQASKKNAKMIIRNYFVKMRTRSEVKKKNKIRFRVSFADKCYNFDQHKPNFGLKLKFAVVSFIWTVTRISCCDFFPLIEFISFICGIRPYPMQKSELL